MSSYKARAIFTNDAGCDDMSTLAYLLLYANDIDIEGLVLSEPASRTDWDQAAGKGPQGRAFGQRIWECLDAYGRVWPNLVVHDGSYPTPDALRRVTRIDSVREAGRTYADTEGAELIRKRILAQDPRPLYLLAAGGTDAIARALRRIEEDWQGTCAWDSVYRQVCDSAIILMDCARDDTYRDYIALTWPGLRTLHRRRPEGAGFRFDEASASCEQLRRCREAWPKPHLADKGPLMALCHIRGDARTCSGETCESRLDCHPDAPSGGCRGGVADVRGALAGEGVCSGFLHLVDKGLRSLVDPTFGGWGGRFVRCRDNDFNPRADYWRSVADDSEVPMGPGAWQEVCWAADWSRDLASRATWCVTDRFEDANHAPEVRIAEGLDLVATPGQELTLHAMADDPDSDAVALSWSRYAEADGCAADVALSCDGGTCTMRVPVDARPTDTIHIICRATDEGACAGEYMVGYARVIVTVA